MTGPEFFDVVLRQRACRSFRADAVDDNLIARVLEAATHAPSAENLQPWVFVVVRDSARRTAIVDLARRMWDGGARDLAAPHLSTTVLADVDEGMAHGFAAAPVIVVVAGDTTAGFEIALPSSIFPAVQNLLLAATALGLGSALTTIATFLADDLRAVVDLPEHVRPMAVVPLGWPARPLGRPRRIPFAEKTYRERFGEPW